MNKTLYLECFSGISGDMTVGALLDLGADKELLFEFLEHLKIEGYHIKVGRSKKCGLDACDFSVRLDDEDHEPMHNAGHTHSHVHRNLQDIFGVLNQIEGHDRVLNLSKKMFEVVAKAEAKAHGIPLEEVHFHEVGAIDSIIDIVSTAFCIDNLGIEDVVISKLYEGQGHVKCQHGIIPVPVPATLNIAAEHNLNLYITQTNGEMVTPTGAAIAAVLKTKDNLPKEYQIRAIGLGAGKKDFEKANVLRAMLIEWEDTKESNTKEDTIWMMQTNLDDCTGEALSYTMEKLFLHGARDVYYVPIFMKKNRPAYLLQVMCEEEQIQTMEKIIFTNTTTIGIRRYPVNRTVLERRIEEIDTSFGVSKVKVCQFGEETMFYPEFESVKALCDLKNADYQTVYNEVILCAKKNKKV